jgi:hypothetical protein
VLVSLFVVPVIMQYDLFFDIRTVKGESSLNSLYSGENKVVPIFWINCSAMTTWLFSGPTSYCPDKARACVDPGGASGVRPPLIYKKSLK